MGQPRPEDAARFAAQFWISINTPTPGLLEKAPLNEAAALAAEAAAARERAGVYVRPPTPPSSEKETVCLRTEKEPASSDPPPSPPSTEQELSPGELQSLTKRAADVRATLEAKRLQRLSLPISKPT